jgi:hypothetical protein
MDNLFTNNNKTYNQHYWKEKKKITTYGVGNPGPGFGYSNVAVLNRLIRYPTTIQVYTIDKQTKPIQNRHKHCTSQFYKTNHNKLTCANTFQGEPYTTTSNTMNQSLRENI